MLKVETESIPEPKQMESNATSECGFCGGSLFPLWHVCPWCGRKVASDEDYSSFCDCYFCGQKNTRAHYFCTRCGRPNIYAMMDLCIMTSQLIRGLSGELPRA